MIVLLNVINFKYLLAGDKCFVKEKNNLFCIILCYCDLKLKCLNIVFV